MRKIVASFRAASLLVSVFISVTAVTIVAGSAVQAQELSPSHMAAAKKAITTTHATVKLNDILPTAASRLMESLIGNRPDLEGQISEIVNETALEIAPRRGDLEKEVAKIYARIFSEDELKTVTEFFATKVGQKFLDELPLVVREVDKASRIWGTGINRDLAQKVQEKMKAAGL